MSPARHNDDQTEAHICRNHGNALLVGATTVLQSERDQALQNSWDKPLQKLNNHEDLP